MKPAGIVMSFAGATQPLLRAFPFQRASERDQDGSEWPETALVAQPKSPKRPTTPWANSSGLSICETGGEQAGMTQARLPL